MRDGEKGTNKSGLFEEGASRNEAREVISQMHILFHDDDRYSTKYWQKCLTETELKWITSSELPISVLRDHDDLLTEFVLPIMPTNPGFVPESEEDGEPETKEC